MVVLVSLQKLKKLCEEYCSKHNLNVSIEIHYTTALAKLENVKANVQGEGNSYDILISGALEGDEFLEALAHELTHIVLQSNQHGNEFEEKKEEVRKWLEKQLKKK